MQTQYEHPLSWKALLRVAIVISAAYLLWQLKGIFIIIVLSLMLASAIYPMVRFLNKKLPLSFASIISIFVIFIPLVLITLLLISTFIHELPGLLSTLNKVIKTSTFGSGFFGALNLNDYIQSSVQYLFSSTPRATGYITTTLAIFFLTLYILVDSQKLYQIGFSFLKKGNRPILEKFIYKLAEINGHYIRGNLLISLICGVIIYIGLLSIGVPYAALLGMFAGILDLLPMIGAIIGAIPAIVLGFAISPATGLLVIVLFMIYQQVENNILAPIIYKKTLYIFPAISFISVIIGGFLFGIIGAFIALPVAASIPSLLKFINEEEHTSNTEPSSGAK